jgi:DNA-directed RNA polymerase specialized sigma subunit
MIDAKSFLQQVEMLDAKIKNKLIERKQWEDIALGITANIGNERVQSSGSQQKMADAVIKCVDMETEIDNLIDELIDTKKKVIETIESLYSPTEYKILHLRYIQCISLTEIADTLNREYTWVTTTHGRALKNVQKILNKQ